MLITGGCGYIGSAVHHYLGNKYEFQTVDLEWFGNYSNPKNIKADFKDLPRSFFDQFDAIIHTASHSSVSLCSNIYESFHNNVINFFELTKKLTTQKLLYASSSCVYVESDGRPKLETEQSKPTDGLTLSKTTIDNLMPLLDLEYYGLRLGSVNGWSPNMRTDLMINSMTTSAIKLGRVELLNSRAYRPIVSTLDLARAVDAILQSSDKRGVYNIASFNKNIGDIGRAVANYMNVPLVDKGLSQTYNFTISSEKFRDSFNFEFQSTIESIIHSITSKPYNISWGRRDVIPRK